MNFDSELVSPFLERLSLTLQGFGEGERAAVLEAVDSTNPDQERELHFELVHNGELIPLMIRIVMDDANAPDLQFIAPTNVVQAITELYGRFSQERRI